MPHICPIGRDTPKIQWDFHSPPQIMGPLTHNIPMPTPSPESLKTWEACKGPAYHKGVLCPWESLESPLKNWRKLLQPQPSPRWHTGDLIKVEVTCPFGTLAMMSRWCDDVVVVVVCCCCCWWRRFWWWWHFHGLGCQHAFLLVAICFFFCGVCVF